MWIGKVQRLFQLVLWCHLKMDKKSRTEYLSMPLDQAFSHFVDAIDGERDLVRTIFSLFELPTT